MDPGAGTGLCGPGGADVSSAPRGSRLVVYLHAWTCRVRRCPPRTDLAKARARLGSTRPMFAAELDWEGTVPRIERWR